MPSTNLPSRIARSSRGSLPEKPRPWRPLIFWTAWLSPTFRALNTSVTAKQSELPFEMAMSWIEGKFTPGALD